MKFYKCKHCGKVITILSNEGVPTICCGEEMFELIPGTTDAAVEKHVPVVSIEGNKVEVVVGSVVHPMTPEHYIQWIVLETKAGYQVKELTPTCEPKASFVLAEGDEIVAVYEYCNLHNLWKA
jgi:superoxide reductase